VNPRVRNTPAPQPKSKIEEPAVQAAEVSAAVEQADE
jgi:hypothetical protein